MFEKRVMRTILGPKGDEVEGRQKRLHNYELHNLSI
jgi:hypothetical protein